MADNTTSGMTDQQYADLKTQVDAETTRRAAEATAGRAAKLKPLTDLVAAPGFAAVQALLPAAIVAATGEPALVQVSAMQTIMANIASAYPTQTAA